MWNREAARAKARLLVSKMTLQEKMSQLVYGAPAIERLGIPAYNWWNEGLHGVARAGSAVSLRHTPFGRTVCPVRNLFCKYWIKLYFCFVPPPFFGAAGPKNIPADGR